MNLKGYNTKPRAIILDILKASKGEHFTAEEILDMLKENQTPVGRATLYRFLDYLVQTGEVKKYIIGDGASACYQYDTDVDDTHYHLRCSICGKVFHVKLSDMNGFVDSIKEKYGFLVDLPRTTVYGICASCVIKEDE